MRQIAPQSIHISKNFLGPCPQTPQRAPLTRQAASRQVGFATKSTILKDFLDSPLCFQVSYVSQESRFMLLHVWGWNLGKCMYTYMQI